MPATQGALDGISPCADELALLQVHKPPSATESAVGQGQSSPQVQKRVYNLKFPPCAFSNSNRTVLLKVTPGNGALRAELNSETLQDLRDKDSTFTAYMTWSSPIYY